MAVDHGREAWSRRVAHETTLSRRPALAAQPFARNGSLADFILALKPRLCHNLVSEACFERILTIARWLPPWLNCGFECHLNAPEKSVDFLVLAHDRTLDCSLPGLDPASDLANFISAHPIWSRIKDLCISCNTPGSLLEESLTDIWWEFDLHTTSPTYLIPNVFMGTREVPTGTDLSAVRAASTRYRRVMGAALSQLVSPALTAEPLTTATECYERMGGEAVGFEVGVMLARETKLLRLFMRNVPKDRLGDCLVTLGWPGSVEKLEDCLSGLLELADCVGLDIDVGESISPKVGIELGFGRRILPAQGKEHEKWVRLFDALVSAHLCLVAKRDALVGWPGGARLTTNYDLQWKGFRLSDYPIYRALSHIKIVIEPGQPLSAKAYFGFIPVDKVHLGCRAVGSL